MNYVFRVFGCAALALALTACGSKDDVEVSDLQKAVIEQEAAQMKAEGMQEELEGVPVEIVAAPELPDDQFSLIEVEVVPESN